MTVKVVGRSSLVVCDLCGEICKDTVFEYARYKVGGEEEEIRHFCSKRCEEDHLGITERIAEEVEKQVRAEINELHQLICPRDKARIRRRFE